jgi:hypothetical protein
MEEHLGFHADRVVLIQLCVLMFVGLIFEGFSSDGYSIDFCRRMDYRCSIDVRWKCPSFLPSFLPSFFLPVLLRPLHFLCSVCASLVPFFPSLKKASRKSIESLSKSIRTPIDRSRKSIESLSKAYRKSIGKSIETSIEHLYLDLHGFPWSFKL